MMHEYSTPMGLELATAIKRHPFEPFWIVMKGGEKFLVHRLMQAALGQRKFVFMPDRGASIWRELADIEGIHSAGPRRESA